MATAFQHCVARVTRQASKTGYSLRSASGVCASIGRAKYGAKGMARKAAAGKRRSVRDNPTAEIYRWSRGRDGVLTAKYIDVDDGRGRTAPGYVLRLHGATAGAFEFARATYHLRKHRWRLVSTGEPTSGRVDLVRGEYHSPAASRLTGEDKRQLRVIMEWLEREVREHGSIPHLRPKR